MEELKICPVCGKEMETIEPEYEGEVSYRCDDCGILVGFHEDSCSIEDTNIDYYISMSRIDGIRARAGGPRIIVTLSVGEWDMDFRIPIESPEEMHKHLYRTFVAFAPTAHTLTEDYISRRFERCLSDSEGMIP